MKRFRVAMTVGAASVLTALITTFPAAAAPTVNASPVGAVESRESARSVFLAYEKANFDGLSKSYSTCGLNKLTSYRGSYKWIAGGQSASMYNTENATGPSHYSFRPDRNEELRSGFGWKSMWLHC
jgi:hypothetical protein